MQGNRVECRSSNDPVGGLACISPDRSRAWMMLYNLIERYTHEPYQTSVIVKLQDLPKGTWSCTKTIIAPGVCDPRPVWESMGSPEKLTAEQRTAILKASEWHASRSVRLDGGVLQVDMAGFSIILLELQRAPQATKSEEAGYEIRSKFRLSDGWHADNRPCRGTYCRWEQRRQCQLG